MRVLGPGTFPAAKPVSFEQLSTGKEDSQFVEIHGVARAVRLEEQRLYFIIEVATGEGRDRATVRTVRKAEWTQRSLPTTNRPAN